MPLNAEERMAHEKYKREQKQYSRPTPEQVEIALLEQQLEHAQNSLGYYEDKVIECGKELEATRNLNDRLDRLVEKQLEQLDQINGAISLFVKGKRKEGVTLDTIINVMGWIR